MFGTLWPGRDAQCHVVDGNRPRWRAHQVRHGFVDALRARVAGLPVVLSIFWPCVRWHPPVPLSSSVTGWFFAMRATRD